MTSTFVSKAAFIARRKLERKPRPERREKQTTLVKEESKAIPEIEKKVRGEEVQIINRKEI